MKNKKLGFWKRFFIQLIDYPFYPIWGRYYDNAIKREKELIEIGTTRKFTAVEFNEFKNICDITRNYIDEWGVLDYQKITRGLSKSTSFGELENLINQ